MIDHNMVLGLHWIGLDGLKTESSVKVWNVETPDEKMPQIELM